LDCLDLANNNDGFNYDDCVSEHNGLVTVAVRPVDFVAEGGSDVEFTGSANSGELRLPLGRMIEYPMITMRISADVLGIVLPVGVPKIVDVVATDASLGDSGNVAVEIENVGDSLGTFNVAIECPSPFSVRGTSPVVQVASGASVVSNIAFSAGEEASAGCVITVSDIENPFNRDISTVRVSATDFGPPCVDGTIQCIGTVEQVCNAGVWEVTGTGACEGVVIPPVTPDMGKLTFALIVAGITILIIVLMVVFKKRGVF